jgi:hypothetical protein
MSNNPQNQTMTHLTAQRNAKNALERVAALETQVDSVTSMFPKLISAISEPINKMEYRLQRIEGQLAGVIEVLDTVVELVGPEQVQKRILENRIKQAAENAKSNQEAIAKGLAEGKLVKTDVVTEKSIIIGKETKEDGTLLEPGWFLLVFKTLENNEDKEALLGQCVGFTRKAPNGNTFEVTDLYEAVPPAPATEVVEVAPTESAEAPAEAVTETPATEATTTEQA